MQYLRCRKQALDKFDKSYALARDYVPNDWYDDIILMGDGSSLLYKKIIAKYYHELVKMNESNMPMRDDMYWDECQR